MGRSALALFALGSAVGCTPGTTVLVQIDEAPGLSIASLSARVDYGGAARITQALPAPGKRPVLPGSLLIELPAISVPIQIALTAMDDVRGPASATATVTSRAHGQVAVTMVLSASSSSGASYVGRIGAMGNASSGTSATLTVGATGVTDGQAILVALLLSSPSVGAVTATDSKGNIYAVDGSFDRSAGADRTLVLSSLNARALTNGDSIRLSFPSTVSFAASAEVFQGVTMRDGSTGMPGGSSGFDSGALATSKAGELLFGAAGIETGAAPTWTAPWTALPDVPSGSDHLGTAYRFAGPAGPYSATGVCNSNSWMAGLAAYY